MIWYLNSPSSCSLKILSLSTSLSCKILYSLLYLSNSSRSLWYSTSSLSYLVFHSPPELFVWLIWMVICSISSLSLRMMVCDSSYLIFHSYELFSESFSSLLIFDFSLMIYWLSLLISSSNPFISCFSLEFSPFSLSLSFLNESSSHWESNWFVLNPSIFLFKV